MSSCHCPQDLISLSQLCASCEAEYLRYVEEINSGLPDPQQAGRPASLEEVEALCDFTVEELACTAAKISQAQERITKLEELAQAQTVAIRALLHIQANRAQKEAAA